MNFSLLIKLLIIKIFFNQKSSMEFILMRNSKSREKHFPIQEDWTLHQKFNLNIFSEQIDPIPISNLTNRKNHKTNRRVRCVYDIVTLFKQLLRKVLKTKVHFYIRHLIKRPKKIGRIASRSQSYQTLFSSFSDFRWKTWVFLK